jgi:SPP1 gp7 family putative phage head morphogenesis protein
MARPASRFATRARERSRSRARNPSRAVRRARSAREPRGPLLRYTLAMRQLGAAFAAAVKAEVIPELERVVEGAGSPKAAVARARAKLRGEPAKVGAAAQVVAERTLEHSKTEFRRLGIKLRPQEVRTDRKDGTRPRLTGIKLREVEPKLDKLITSWRRENVDKITSLIGNELDTIEALLSDGEGRRVESLAKEIERRFEVTRSKAELLARDQVLKLNSNITQERQRAAGIEEYIWTSSGDERVRDRHADLDGETFRWDDPPVTNEDGDRNHPGEDYQCRCTAYPVLPELEDEDPETLANNMGAGLALQAALRWGELPRWYGAHCKRTAPNTPVVERADLGLIFFPVKPLLDPSDPERSWNQQASLGTIEKSLSELVKLEGRITLTFPGCGNGGLDRSMVEPLLRRYLTDDRFTVVDRTA